MDEKTQLEAYLRLYEVAAKRYENLYQSMWTIFSYMSAIAAAIFTFAGSRTYIEPLLACGLLPLVFWYVTTYFPLDRYGDACLQDLKRLETCLQDLSIGAKQFKGFDDKRQERGQYWRRARSRIIVSFVVILTAWLYGLAVTAEKLWRGYELAPRSPGSSIYALEKSNA
jgi:hypothetical protein